MRESDEVEARVEVVANEDDVSKVLERNPGKLVVLEVLSDTECHTGLSEEAEWQWKRSSKTVMAPCQNIKHVFQRTARNCPDAVFLEHYADDSDPASTALCKRLGIDFLPSLVFFKDNQIVWRKQGYLEHDANLGQGVMYYAGSMAEGRAEDFVTELHSLGEMREWVAAQPPGVLACVNVSTRSDSCCIKVYPAVVALAKNFRGVVNFARIVADESEVAAEVFREFQVREVPSFLFFRGGKEVNRFATSSRADLLGQVLQATGGP